MKSSRHEYPLSCHENEEASEKFINYLSKPPPLQSIALASVAVRLWDVFDTSEARNSHREFNKEFYRLEKEVLRRIQNTLLPDLLKARLFYYVRPIGLQLFRWVYGSYVYSNLTKLRMLGGSLHWTGEGTVDELRTFETIKNTIHLIKGEKEFSALYDLACTFCREEHISEIWLEKRHPFYRNNTYEYRYHIIAYWTAVQRNELPLLMSKLKPRDPSDIYDINRSIYENMVSLSITTANIYSLKYFWSKLTEKTKKDNLERWVEHVMRNIRFYYERCEGYSACDEGCQDTYIMCFLLSQLNDHSKQKLVFEADSEVILKSLFFHWPLQRFLLQTLTVMFDFIDGKVYLSLMKVIVHSIYLKARPKRLLLEIWYISPSKFKKCFVDFLRSDDKIAKDLIHMINDAMIEVILKELS